MEGELTSLLTQGHAMIRAERGHQQMVAIQRPRDEKKAHARALAALETGGQLFAQTAFYSIEYKDKRKKGGKSLVEGPSIGAAMEMVRCWGNCASGACIVSEDEDSFECLGTFLDLETNVYITRPVRVSKWAKRDNAWVKLDPQFQTQALQAGVSKAQRNAILRSLPVWFVDQYFEAAKVLAAGGKDAGKKVNKGVVTKIRKAFEEKGINPEQLEDYLGEKLDGLTQAGYAKAKSLWQAYKDGQVRFDEVFKSEAEPQGGTPKSTPAAPGPSEEAPGQGGTKKPPAQGKVAAALGEAPPVGPVLDDLIDDGMSDLKTPDDVFEVINRIKEKQYVDAGDVPPGRVIDAIGRLQQRKVELEQAERQTK